ncbi:MFS transporter [uncultured Pseudomonas sp.]|uniref:MFS transporter n=1 Tax=uncultured Pseudomonas sp. TaxID=114707 RepID=UPI0030D7E17B
MRPSPRSLVALDGLNLFLADVRDGVGPYLGVYLLATQGWKPEAIGAALSAAGIAGVLAQAPLGMWLDATRMKRALLALAVVLISLACVVMAIWPIFTVVIAAQWVIGISAALIGPALAGMTLGLVGPKLFARRQGRNEGWNHTGNVLAALLAGAIGHYVSLLGVFYLNALMGLGALLALATIRGAEIDHRLACAASSGPIDRSPVAWRVLLADRRLLAFAVSAVLFHFANAAMLPLAGQMLGTWRPEQVALWMSACIVTAQLVMIPVAVIGGRLAERLGRKPVFLVAFAVLPLRGLLYVLADEPWMVVAIQVLDGVGAGLFGVLAVVMLADLTRGTGRFNAVQGALGSMIGLGAALSNLLAGFVVGSFGYAGAFIFLAFIAFIAMLAFGFLVEESQDTRQREAQMIEVPTS